MAVIQSHYNPYKSLRTHIDEVTEASRQIETHHSGTVGKLLGNALALAARFHDLGKATPAFQDYIKNPGGYRKDPLQKAHTPVSLLLWLIFARDHDLPEDLTLLVATVIWKHHGDFPTFRDDLINDSLYEYETLYRIDRYPLDRVNEELGLSLSLAKADYELQVEDIIPKNYLESHDLETAARLKLRAQLLFSALIESDRAFLALAEEFRGKKEESHAATLPPDLVDRFIKEKTGGKTDQTRLNRYRTRLRQQIITASSQTTGIESVTLPTGLGKTLIAAQWALTHRQNRPYRRKVIIVLPFLSIIDQTVKEYKHLFSGQDIDALILEAHSIAGRNYKEGQEEDQHDDHNNAVDFYAETWRYDFIITTFDQFLYTLLSPSKKHLIRFHNLADSLVIIDEIQALPTELWEPLNLSMNMLTRTLNTKVLIMSATQPGFLPVRELVESPGTVFSRQNRYRLVLKHDAPLALEHFIEETINRIETENWHRKRTLIVLNTRRSARSIIDALEGEMNCSSYFLSADVTPKERLHAIEQIKKNQPCLVVATQCIEAGVDIDMDLVIRDFAPLDSIVQCAGRCNRNGEKKRADVEVVCLYNPNGKKFSELVYDSILLEKTHMVLSRENNEIPEEKVFTIVAGYFQLIRKKMNTGQRHAENWAYWRKNLNVKKMLRGDNEKIEFIVESQDVPSGDELPLREALHSAIETEDRWKRSRKLRSLKSRIALVSVSVWATREIDPVQVSEKIGCYHFLEDEYYQPGRGLNLGPAQEEQCNIFL